MSDFECLREEGGRKEGRKEGADTKLKTKTPHVNVGKNDQPNSWHPWCALKHAEILFIQLLRDQVFVTARNEGTTTCGIHASAFLWANSLVCKLTQTSQKHCS